MVAAGNATVVWTVKGTAYGSLEADGGSEGELSAQGAYRIRLRYRNDITARWRLGLKGTSRKFAIAAPPMDPDGRRRELEIRAIEVRA